MAALILAQEESIISEMNNLGNSAADDRRYDLLRAKRKDLYFEAIPYLQQDFGIDSSKYQAAKTLSNIYSALGDDINDKKYREISDGFAQ